MQVNKNNSAYIHNDPHNVQSMKINKLSQDRATEFENK